MTPWPGGIRRNEEDETQPFPLGKGQTGEKGSTIHWGPGYTRLIQMSYTQQRLYSVKTLFLH